MFQKRHFFKVMRASQSRRLKSLTKIAYLQLTKQRQLKAAILTCLYQRSTDPDYLLKKQSVLHYQHKLVRQSFNELNRFSYLQLTAKTMIDNRESGRLRRFMQVWHSAYLGTQVHKEAAIYFMKKRLIRQLRAWSTQAKTQRLEAAREQKMIAYRQNKIKVRIFSVFSSVLKRGQELYKVDIFDKHWILAEKHNRFSVFSAFLDRMRQEVVLGKLQKKLGKKYRQIGLFIYWDFIRARYLKNIAIRSHQQDKPLAVKTKCFMAFKKRYLINKEQKRQIVKANLHSRNYKIRTGFIKLVKHMKAKKNFSLLKQRAHGHYMVNTLILKAFNSLKAKWAKSKLLESRYHVCKEKLASLALKRTFVTLKSKTQAKRLLEAASVYYKRH